MEIQSADPLGPRPASATPRATLSRARRALLALLEERGPATLTTLAEISGLHENTVRGHLDGLAADGLVDRAAGVPRGRGRPAWLWRVRSSASEEYAGLAAALARMLRRSSAHPEDDAIGAGRDWGHSLAAGRRGDAAAGRSDATTERSGAAERVRDLLDTVGFAPQGRLDSEGGELRLTRCPLLEAATEEPAIVCNVHLGLVVGALEEYGAPDPDAELLPFAEPGACVLRLREGPR